MKATFTPANFTESAKALQNPYCGFYRLLQYLAADEKDPQDWIAEFLVPQAGGLCLLEINLQEYSSRPLDPSALAGIDRLFSAAHENNIELIVRFLYDWDGKPLNTEPKDLSLVRTHITELSDIVNRHTDCIYILQGCLTGAYGEMHDGRFSTSAAQKELITLLAESIDPTVFLAVRRPVMQRLFTESSLSVTKKNAFDGSHKARLGLYNDGIFGSETDLGTYAAVPASISGTGTPSAAWKQYPERPCTRPAELSFQDKLCTFVPNGGEAVGTTAFSVYLACIRDLMQMHVSYLNADYDPKLISAWKEKNCTDTGQFLSGRSAFDGITFKKNSFNESVFDGCSLYDYVSAHLGYRYLITSAEVKPAPPGRLNFRITIENRGFAPAYRKFETTLILLPMRNVPSASTEPTDITEPAAATKPTHATELAEQPDALFYPVSFDNRFLQGNGATAQLALSIPKKDLPEGAYEVRLTMKDPKSGKPIYFANTSNPDVLLGSLIAREREK